MFTHNAARSRSRFRGWSLSALDLRIGSKVLEATLVLTTELVLSSVSAFANIYFINSCASASCINQSLKSRSVGFFQCFWAVKIDLDCFILCGNFCTAALRSEVLIRSFESFETDLKTPRKPEIFAQ